MNRSLTLATVMLPVLFASGYACATRDTSVVTTPPPRTSEVTSTAPTAPQTVPSADRGSIPVGQEIDVRLSNSLSSETAQVEQRFEATTAVDLMQDGRVLVPAGSIVQGIVSSVDKAGRVDRAGSLTLTFDRIRVRGRDQDMRATATQIFESKGIRGEAGTAGVGAGVGGIVGGIIGGVKGAILGAAIGAGGAIAATDGKDIELPAGSVVRIRFDTPVRVVG
ncbi:MAG TPA: hypothetical protein VKA59_21915 [Vicinamibacterales bacterium]|jgi:hypothetical protein|nr:hypothetical protein [Vicinamibacterales bacterium]